MKLIVLLLSFLFLLSCSSSKDQAGLETKAFLDTAGQYQLRFQYDSALIYVNKALVSDSTSWDAYQMKIMLLYELGRDAEVLEVVRKLKKYNHLPEYYLQVMGGAYYRNGMPDSGRYFFQKALKTLPDTNFSLVMNRAAMLYFVKNRETALKELQKVDYDKLNEAEQFIALHLKNQFEVADTLALVFPEREPSTVKYCVVADDKDSLCLDLLYKGINIASMGGSSGDSVTKVEIPLPFVHRAEKAGLKRCEDRE